MQHSLIRYCLFCMCLVEYILYWSLGERGGQGDIISQVTWTNSEHNRFAVPTMLQHDRTMEVLLYNNVA